MHWPKSGAKLLLLCLLLSLAAFGGVLSDRTSAAAPRSVPLPPPRPPDLVAPKQLPTVQPRIAPTRDDNDALRAHVLASGHVLAESLPPIADKDGCGIDAPLRLDAVLLANGAKVAISPPAILRASLASALADWIRDDLTPAAAPSGDQLAKLAGVGAYVCRDRDGKAGAKLSEHAKGNALDFLAFVTKRGTRYAVAASATAQPAQAVAFWTLMKTTACRRFTTVLGPGSDRYHSQHLHLDLEARHHDTHLCEWSLSHDALRVAAPPKP
ncbi:MAG: extensin-like domain-containing protein [Methylovirgula sp.]